MTRLELDEKLKRCRYLANTSISEALDIVSDTLRAAIDYIDEKVQ